jgi:hypothetical protein
MTDKRQEPRAKDEEMPESLHSAHPVEPAEGPREPGQGANVQRPPHPVEPAEGDRASVTE